jgi:predicted nucleic acid-binding protein
MIVLELAGGARRERESRELSEDLEALKQLRTTETVWRLAYRMAHTLRSKGLSIPAADVLITAVAVNYGCHLLHDDNHFDLMARHVALAVWKR